MLCYFISEEEYELQLQSWKSFNRIWKSKEGWFKFFFFYNLKFYHVIVYTKLQAQLSQKISIFLIIKSSASPLKALKSKELFMRTDVSYQQTSKRNTPNRLIVHALTRQMQRTSQHRCETAYLSPYLEISRVRGMQVWKSDSKKEQMANNAAWE